MEQNYFRDDTPYNSIIKKTLYDYEIPCESTIQMKELYKSYKSGIYDEIIDEYKILDILSDVGFPIEHFGTYFYMREIKLLKHIIDKNSNSIRGFEVIKHTLEEIKNNEYSSFYFLLAVSSELGINIRKYHAMIEEAFNLYLEKNHYQFVDDALEEEKMATIGTTAFVIAAGMQDINNDKIGSKVRNRDNKRTIINT